VSYLFHYSHGLDSWHIAYQPGVITGYPEPEYDLPGSPPDGSFTMIATVTAVSDKAAVGLVLRDTDGKTVAMLGAWNLGPFEAFEGGENLYVHEDPTHSIDLQMQYDADAGVVRTLYRTMGVWQPVAEVPVATPADTGLLLIYTDELIPVDGYLSGVVQLDGLGEFDAETEITVTVPSRLRVTPQVAPMGLKITLTSEPLVYGIVGAPFGDQEFDVGKSVRWLVWFTDKQFILDVNFGEPRFWIVNWSMTFPSSDHTVTGINFFRRPAEFRKEQFAQADLLYKMDPNGWTLWVDASEGLSFFNDPLALPDDYNLIPFKSFVYREIQRAEDAGRVYAVLPFFVYLKDGVPQNFTYDTPANDPTGVIPPVMQAMSQPHYHTGAAFGLKRLIKVSALRDLGFDWTSLDTPVSPSPGVKAQIISYAYAHWQMPNIPPGNDTVPPINEYSDEGWKMRRKISQVRPISGITFDTWPGTEPAGYVGPLATKTLLNTHPGFEVVYDNPLDPEDDLVKEVQIPLYDTAFRLNMRDGVWYEGDVSGNTPLAWDGTKWVTPYDPNQWPDKGVDAPVNPDFVPPPTPTA
jgi:hypothetical protein